MSGAFALHPPIRRVIVRPAGPDDVDGMARVSVDTWRLTYEGILPAGYLERMRRNRHERERRRLMLEDGVHHFVAVESAAGEVVGFVSCGPSRGGPSSAEIYELYVQCGFQGQGLGRRLMHAAMDRLARDGHGDMIVWVLSQNPNLPFYPRMGGRLHIRKTIGVGGAPVEETAFVWTLGRAG